MEHITEEPGADTICTVYIVVMTVYFFHSNSINKNNMFNLIYNNNIKYNV